MLPDKKIALVTMYDDNCKSYAQLSDITKKEYCRLHNYDYICMKQNAAPGKHPVWGKIRVVRDLLNTYDIVIWVDADAIIANKNFNIQPYIIDNFDLYISQDNNGINTGIFIIKNTETGKKILDQIWNSYRQFQYVTFRQQACLGYLWKTKYGPNIRILPHKLINSYDDIYPQRDRVNIYKQGDFILHLPNERACNKVHPDYRVWRFQQILEKYYKELL